MIAVGMLLAVAGLLLVGLSWLAGGRGWRLPGDLVLRRDGVTIYLPIATSILLSLLLTALLTLIAWMGRR